MKYIYEYRDRFYVDVLAKKIWNEAEKLNSALNIMEVCGTHTMAIARYGIRKLLPPSLNLLSGPGCPVCVTPVNYLDKAVEFARLPDTVVVTFGDMLRVPGSFSSLEKEKASRNNVKIVYSPFDCLKLAETMPGKKVVFLGVGFETTAPSAALVFKEAQRRGISNLFIFSGHKLIIPAMELLLDSGEVRIDGFICPGHASAVIGTLPYLRLSENFKVPCVISGFEPVDIMHSILILTAMAVRGENARVENQYKRVVSEEGNKRATEVIRDFFVESDSLWRGIGKINRSGLAVNEKYGMFDAEKIFNVNPVSSEQQDECICGQILKGVKTPPECKLFRAVCSPENPVGPCMVSSEGTCAAFYNYG